MDALRVVVEDEVGAVGVVRIENICAYSWFSERS